MNILITGGTGFIGQHLAKFFLKQKHNVIILSRSQKNTLPGVELINSLEQIKNNQKIEVVINLAGAPIKKRWTESYKKTLINSRIDTTRNLIELIKSLEHKPQLLISASAIGYYGSSNLEYVDETSEYIQDFSHELCNSWEKEAIIAQSIGVRTCIARLGVVIGKNGGVMKEILPIFKLGLGGKIGSGKQFFSWVHIEDVVRIFNFFISEKRLTGAFNITSPSPVTNLEFTKNLSLSLNRPAIFPLAEFIVKTLFGEMGESLLLKGAAIYPKKLLDSGYQFKYTNINSALDSLVLCVERRQD